MEWISIENALPEDSEKCLVYGILEYQEEYDIYKAVFHKEVFTDNVIESQFWEAEWGYDFIIITHWMPLPKTPKDKDESFKVALGRHDFPISNESTLYKIIEY